MSLKTEIKHRAALWVRDCSYKTASLSGFLSFRLVIAILIFCPAATVCGKVIKNNSAINTAKNISAVAVVDVPVIPLWGGAALAANHAQQYQERTIALHHFDQPCTNCHDSSSANSSSEQTDNKPGPITSDINSVCTLSCHNYEQSMNHPVDVIAAPVSSDMPLGRYQRITCLTCHTQPAGSTDSDSGNLDEYPLLRTQESTQLCLSCHENISGSMKRQTHWQFSNKAHLGNINPAASTDETKNNFAESFGDIDKESNACLGCHSDMTVTIVPFFESESQKRDRWTRMKDHPMGMEYRRVALEKRTKYPYHYPIANPNVRLFDGKVGCGSCHSLYSATKNYLANDDGFNALCRDCHDN
jgi:predicted CXXCH cytochrome family protein